MIINTKYHQYNITFYYIDATGKHISVCDNYLIENNNFNLKHILRRITTRHNVFIEMVKTEIGDINLFRLYKDNIKILSIKRINDPYDTY